MEMILDTGYSILVGNPAFAGMIKFLYQVSSIQYPASISIIHFLPINREDYITKQINANHSISHLDKISKTLSST